VPHFNDIFYLRTRLSMDAGAAEFSHFAVRPGLFLAFGQLDVSAFTDAAFYAATPNVRPTGEAEVTAGLQVSPHFWWRNGSFDVEPGFIGTVDATKRLWQATIFVNVLASYRRGLRDFSSLELDFPEQLGGGVPWRGRVVGAGP
jgi:hypothetical protein